MMWPRSESISRGQLAFAGSGQQNPAARASRHEIGMKLDRPIQHLDRLIAPAQTFGEDICFILQGIDGPRINCERLIEVCQGALWFTRLPSQATCDPARFVGRFQAEAFFHVAPGSGGIARLLLDHRAHEIDAGSRRAKFQGRGQIFEGGRVVPQPLVGHSSVNEGIGKIGTAGDCLVEVGPGGLVEPLLEVNQAAIVPGP